MDFIIETERLYLRELVASDDVGMFELDSDPEVHRFIENKPIQHIEESQEAIRYIQKQYAENGIGRWAVLLKDSNTFIGWAGIKVEHNVNGKESFYDLGYRFIPKYWGKGYSTEASKALVDYGFNTLKLPTICAYAFTKHTASRNVLKKVGLKEITSFFADGDDNVWYEYDKADYDAANS